MTDGRYRRLCEIAGPVSRETYERLVTFESLFNHWAAKINLVGPSTIDQLWERHILDSAQLLPLSQGTRWVDLGSGGGFPGAIIAILVFERGGKVHLVESNRKKAAFLTTAMATLGVNAQVYAMRIGAALKAIGAADVVTARALATLPALLNLAEPWLSGGALGLFHKGRDFRREVEESLQEWSFDLVEHRSVVDPEGVILAVRDLRRR
ncbi:MAG: 16S rRNA (guanine(527)-N(7))-methyltransferase RsmG [Mesorhizobium sp.]